MAGQRDRVRFARVLLARAATVEKLDQEWIARGNDKSARLPNAVIADLAAQGVLALKNGVPSATAQTRTWLRRAQCTDSLDQAQGFTAQHQHIRADVIASGEGAQKLQSVRRNDHESPLAKLALRKQPDKSPYILPHHIVAGERLRRDFEKAHLTAPTTMHWNAGYSSGTGFHGDEVSDLAIDARTRLNKCHAALGREMAGVLIDFCGYLKGLETIELERGWPRRSAKLAIRLALDQLARHYGLEEMTTADPARPTRPNSQRGWGEKPGSMRTSSPEPG